MSEKSIQANSQSMLAHLQAAEKMILDHFPASNEQRKEAQRLIHQLWAMLFLGYSSAPAVNAEAPFSLEPSIPPEDSVPAKKRAKAKKKAKR